MSVFSTENRRSSLAGICNIAVHVTCHPGCKVNWDTEYQSSWKAENETPTKAAVATGLFCKQLYMQHMLTCDLVNYKSSKFVLFI